MQGAVLPLLGQARSQCHGELLLQMLLLSKSPAHGKTPSNTELFRIPSPVTGDDVVTLPDITRSAAARSQHHSSCPGQAAARRCAAAVPTRGTDCIYSGTFQWEALICVIASEKISFSEGKAITISSATRCLPGVSIRQSWRVRAAPVHLPGHFCETGSCLCQMHLQMLEVFQPLFKDIFLLPAAFAFI